MRHANLLSLACLSGMLLSFAGCAGKIRYPSYYVLNLPAPVAVATQPKPLLGSVAVRKFDAPAFLRAGAIVYRPSAEELNFYNYHRWAMDPRSAVTTAVVNDMRASGVFQSVHLFDGRGTSDYLVTGRLEHLEEVDQGQAVYVEVGLSAQLMNFRTGEVVWTDTSSETTKLEHHTIPGIVAGMSQAAETAVEHLVSSMQNRVSSTSPSLGGSRQTGQ
ncbi:MAG: ABC-type transport auxiliary lipoprotein family protein [Bryobacteraceae bacterium]